MLKKIDLTKSEENLMELFWNAQSPLTSVQIMEIAKGYSWNGNYLHVMLKSLQNKGMIEVCGLIQYGNQYARQFKPSVTKSEYGAKLIISKGLVESVSQVTVALANETKDTDREKLIDQLEKLIGDLRSG